MDTPIGMQQLWPWSSNLIGQKLSAKTDLSFLVIFSFSKLSTINRAKSAETTEVDQSNFVHKI